MRSGSIPGISGLDSPRLDEEDCWSGHWGGGSNAHQWEKSAAQICAVVGSSGKIGSAYCSTNMGWTPNCPGQVGKFIKGIR